MSIAHIVQVLETLKHLFLTNQVTLVEKNKDDQRNNYSFYLIFARKAYKKIHNKNNLLEKKLDKLPKD